MDYLVVGLVTVSAVESFLRLPFRSQAASLQQALTRARSIMLSPRISDHWKEKALLAYAARIMRATATIAVSLAVVALAALATAWLLARVLNLDRPIAEILGTWPALTVSIIIATIYVVIRGRLVRE